MSVDAVLEEVSKHKSQRYVADDFVVDPGVPIFDAHDGASYGVDLVFDHARLEEIANNTNHRIQDTGDLVPVYAGHTKDNVPEGEQGELLGFATNLTLGTLGNLEPRDCILADLLWLKSKYETAREFPRRSVELWFDDMVIDAIAALKRRPQRDLGLLFHKKRGERTTYSRTLEEVSVEQNPVEQKAEPWVEELSQRISHLEALVDKEARAKMKAEADCEDMADEDEDEDKMKAEADCEDKLDEEEEEEPGKLRAQYRQTRRQYSKLLTSHRDLEARVIRFEREARVAQRRADLVELEAENIHFEIGEELAYVSDLSEEDYKKHLARMRKNYNKAPVGIRLPAQATTKPTEDRGPDAIYSKLKTASIKSVDMSMAHTLKGGKK